MSYKTSIRAIIASARTFGLAAALSVFGLNPAAAAKPAIQSINVAPTPLNTGQPFTITVTASPDVTQGIATVDFRPGNLPPIDLPLVKQGAVWTAVGVVPAGLHAMQPDKGDAKIKVVVVDSAFRRDSQVIHADVNVPTVFAVFEGGVLSVTGDDEDNNLVVTRDFAGNLLVNNGAVVISGEVPTVSNTTLIRMLGLGGNDTLTVDNGGGLMPPSNLVGGEGDDTLIGSSSADELEGGPGNDTLIGRAGDDILSGGPGNDSLNGGQGSDQIFGGAGDDQIVWNPGDGSDLVEGQNGQDTLLFNGANIGEVIDLAANGTRLRFFRNIANITMDCDGIEFVSFRALGGADQITVNDLTGTKVKQVTLDLSASLGGGDALADTVIVNGTASNDHVTINESATQTTVTGLRAAVSIVGADQNLDQLIVNTLGGTDEIDLYGSEENETIALSPNGQAVRFQNNGAPLLTDLNGTEYVNLHPLGGADQVTVNDLTGTAVSHVVVDLRDDNDATDGQHDTVTIFGTEGNDQIVATASAYGISVAGLSSTVAIVGADGSLDKLVINSANGDDTIDASSLEAGDIDLTLNGGLGNDRLIGGEGNDLLIGGRGDDAIFGGAGDDTFTWNPGDGSDILEGQDGVDTMLFNGANIGEVINLSANGPRLRFTRNVANITMDSDGIEIVRFTALGGADTISVSDLTGTAVTAVNLDLSATPGSGVGDNLADTVIVNATQGPDVITITGSGGQVSISGLSATVNISGSEPALDRLVVNGLEGDDVIEASGLPTGLVSLTEDGGPGDDVLIGSGGLDTLLGGAGDDVLEGGPGQDVLDGGPGANVVIQD